MALVTKCTHEEQLVCSSGLKGWQKGEKQDTTLLCYCHPLPCATGKLPQVKGLWQQVKRITESFSLEKNLKTFESNHQSSIITMFSTKPCHGKPHPYVSWTFPGTMTPPLPWAACTRHGQPIPGLGNPFNEQIFLNTQPKPPHVEPETVTSHLVTWRLGGDWHPPGYTHLSGNCRLQQLQWAKY